MMMMIVAPLVVLDICVFSQVMKRISSFPAQLVKLSKYFVYTVKDTLLLWKTRSYG